jgi:hypothetical protein
MPDEEVTLGLTRAEAAAIRKECAAYAETEIAPGRKGKWSKSLIGCFYNKPPTEYTERDDLTRKELEGMIKNRMFNSIPLTLEHNDKIGQIGVITNAYQNEDDGSCFAEFAIDCSTAIGRTTWHHVRNKKLVSLSLSHWLNERKPNHLSLCMHPARQNCYLINAKYPITMSEVPDAAAAASSSDATTAVVPSAADTKEETVTLTKEEYERLKKEQAEKKKKKKRKQVKEKEKEKSPKPVSESEEEDAASASVSSDSEASELPSSERAELLALRAEKEKTSHSAFQKMMKMIPGELKADPKFMQARQSLSESFKKNHPDVLVSKSKRLAKKPLKKAAAKPTRTKKTTKRKPAVVSEPESDSVSASESEGEQEDEEQPVRNKRHTTTHAAHVSSRTDKAVKHSLEQNNVLMKDMMAMMNSLKPATPATPTATTSTSDTPDKLVNKSGSLEERRQELIKLGLGVVWKHRDAGNNSDTKRIWRDI